VGGRFVGKRVVLTSRMLLARHVAALTRTHDRNTSLADTCRDQHTRCRATAEDYGCMLCPPVREQAALPPNAGDLWLTHLMPARTRHVSEESGFW